MMTRSTRVQQFESLSSDAHLEGIAVRRQPKVNGRDIVRVMGGLGLATAGMVVLGKRAAAYQEAPASPVATPQIGPQSDGTNLWKVVVGGMDMENEIEYMGFFPGEITINAGDSIWFAEEMPMFHTVTFPGPEQLPPII